MDNQLIVASVQMYCHEDQEKNLDTMEEYLTVINKAFPNVELVVFPELSVHGSIGNISNESEEIPGKLTSVFSKMAKKYNLWLIPGSIYESVNKDVFNTTPVFSANGDFVGKYRKRYPWSPYEKTTPGEQPFVFNINGKGNVGVMICYDMWFPEVARDLVNCGAELLVVPTMTTTGDRYQEKTIAKATAITQQSYLISCNGVGRGGVGGSLIIDPEGSILQESNEGPYMQTAIIDFERVRTTREKGVAGVTTPVKDFKQNQQNFSVYNPERKRGEDV